MNNLVETLCVQITLKCNLICTHCRAASSPRTKIDINLPLVKEFLSAVKSIGLKHVSISGGEPGVDKRIGDFTNWLLSEGFYVTITTNGTNHLLSQLKSSNVIPSRRLRINVSIDGAKDTHNEIRGDSNFQNTVLEIPKIKSWLGWVGVNTVITPKVRSSLPELVPFIKSLDVDRWALITPVPRGRYQEKDIDSSEILQMTLDSRVMVRNLGFDRKIVVYNFVGTPHTSMLVDANGLIRITGLNNKDDIIVGDLERFSIVPFGKAIELHKNSKLTKCFNWKNWKNEETHKDMSG